MTMTVDDARRRALAFPETTEEPHFDMTSFRVRGKIFVTVPPAGTHLHVLVDEAEARSWAAEDPQSFEELWWGKRLAALRVTLASAPPDVVGELIEEAWRRKAPKRVVAAYDAASR